MTTTQKPAMQQRNYRGRVRSGCLTCRSRKVKCDEGRPTCHNCTRLEKQCVYQARRSSRRPETTPSSRSPAERSDARRPGRQLETQDTSQPESHSTSATQTNGILETSPSDHQASPEDPFMYPDSSIVDVTARLERALADRYQNATPDEPSVDADSPATLISRDIELTTTMDLLAACSEPSRLTSFFLESVDCPGVTPFDSVNWHFAKCHIVELGKTCSAIMSGITAVATLFKAQLYGLSPSRSLSQYRSTRAAHEELLGDPTQDFSCCLVVVLLLCLFEVAQSGDGLPTFKDPSQLFLERLGAWAQHAKSHSELALRLTLWIKMLQVVTMRGGGMGLLSDSIYSLLPDYDGPFPSIKPPASREPGLSTHLHNVLCAPVFDFYFHLQILSGEIAKLTHYHRSRTTGVDQKEVAQLAANIKSRLRELWNSRSATQRQTPQDLRDQLAPKVANTVIQLVGICNAAYHAEFVELDRVLGDPVSQWTDSRYAIRAIREIVDSRYACSDTIESEGLNPGYLRPLFLCAIECMDREENQWAAERIAQIRDPIYRGTFFSTFAKELSNAQMRKERRVTSKYFCIWYFGVPPPYM
ncbi:Transcriptional regulatory moc3 [Fusarium albosuccineum]|uniref:Transcriptional regulatory moc3 n=1 Tax=Fusarium albosuccineum TaxID=1237068 RepID=A0A8H4LNV4_9HYPO|nr:Transcriptional regulatory moc3 [Fusarium albosuccineum]